MPAQPSPPRPSRVALIWAVALSSALGGLLGAALWTDFSADRRLLADAARQQAGAVSTVAASRIDAEALQRGITATPEGGFTRWEDAPDDLWIQRAVLLDIQQSLPPATTIEVVRLHDAAVEELQAHPARAQLDGVEVLLSTAEAPVWRGLARYEPDIHHGLLNGDSSMQHRPLGGDVLAQAGAPIRDPSGRVVAALSIRYPLADAQAGLEDELLGRGLIFGSAWLLLSLGLLLWARRDHGLTVAQSQLAQARNSALERASQLDREGARLTVARDLALRGIDPVARERRKRFAAKTEEIVVNLDLSDRKPIEGTLLDLGFHEAYMRVEAPLDIARGAVARLSVWVPLDDYSSCYEVVIKSCHSEGGCTELGLHLSQIDRLQELPPRLGALIKDRDAQRVAPDPKQPMVATLRVGTQAAAGQVRDLSSTGVGVVVQQSLAKVSAWGTRAELLLLLPGADGPLFIEAQVTRLYSVPGGTLLGMRFSEADAPKVGAVVATMLAESSQQDPALAAAG